MKNKIKINNYKTNHPLLEGVAAEPIQLAYFLNAIESITSDYPSMIELGVSDNPIYSSTFNDIFENECINICSDILERQIISAKEKFKNAIYYHGYSGIPKHTGENLPNPNNPLEKVTERIKVKELMKLNRLNKIDILHFDLQGSEVTVLEELKEDNLFDVIGYIFISIHNTYNECIDIIKTINCLDVLYSDPFNGGYGDGLIICKNKNFYVDI